VIGDIVAGMGGAVDIGGAPDDSTAGKPIIVFLRGGLEEYGVFTSAFGGGVTTGGDEGEVPVSRTKRCLVGRAEDLGLEVWIGGPNGTDRLACDESRRGRAKGGGVTRGTYGAGVTNGGALEPGSALSSTSRIAAANQGASARRIANEHAISRSVSEAGTTSVRPAP
jgi:hypothetical protein